MVAITKFLPAYAGLAVEDEFRHLALLLENPKRPFVVVIGGAKIEDKLAVISQMARVADAVLLGGKTGLLYAKAIRELEINKLGEKKTTNSLISNLLIDSKQNVFCPIDDIDRFDIGPKTIEFFTDKISAARTIFWNGNLGKSEEPKYLNGTQSIANAIANSAAQVKIAGGGDTIAFIHQAGLAEKFTYLSTGGGATIDYLAGKEMPGLDALRASPRNCF
jgi:phosphoglycerate kinase